MDPRDAYDSDYGQEHERLIRGLAEFLVEFSRLTVVLAAALTEYFGVPESRRTSFNEAFLADLSVSRMAPILGRAMGELDLDRSKALPKALKDLTAFRNRLAHDVLSFPDRENAAWPVLERIRPFVAEMHQQDTTAADFEKAIDLCRSLQDEVLVLLGPLSAGR